MLQAERHASPMAARELPDVLYQLAVLAKYALTDGYVDCRGGGMATDTASRIGSRMVERSFPYLTPARNLPPA